MVLSIALELVIAVGTIAILGLTALVIYLMLRFRRPDLEAAFSGGWGADGDWVMLGVIVRNHGDGRARQVRVSSWVNDAYHSEAEPVDIGPRDWREIHVRVGPPVYTGGTTNGFAAFNGVLSVRAHCPGSKPKPAVWPYN